MDGPTTPPAVPPGWKAVWSKSKKAYYFVSPTKESFWALPRNKDNNLPDGWQKEGTFYVNTLTGSTVLEKPTKEISNAIRKSVVERNKGKTLTGVLQGYAVPQVGIPAPDTCGLRNPDITCYMNSSIQLLYSIDDFRNKILASRSRNPYIQALRMVFFMMANTPADANGRRVMSPPITQLTMELSDQPDRPFSLRALFSTLTIDYDDDRIGHQMDASEFINNLLDKINNTIRRDSVVRNSIQAREYSAENVASPNILEKIGQITKSEYNCLHGGRRPDNVDIFEYIAALKKEDSLDWTSDINVQMLLDTYENNENDPDNWFNGCNPPPGNGGTKGAFTKRTVYLPTSEYFLCQLTPYIYSDARQVPEGSHIGDIAKDPSGNRLRPVILNPTIRINNVTYGLSGYILHLGRSLRSGHYVYVKCGDDNAPLTVIDDSNVIPAADSDYGTMDTQKRHAYVALYKRIGGGAAINPAELEAIRARNAEILAGAQPAPAPARLTLRLNQGSSLGTLRQLLEVKGVRIYTDAELNAMIGRAVPDNWAYNTGTVTRKPVPAVKHDYINMTANTSAPGATMSPGTIKQLKAVGLLGGRYKKTRKNKLRRRSSRRHLKRKF